MDDGHDQTEEAAQRAYTRAIAGGANIHVSFDLACNAYRAGHPDLQGVALRAAVARAIGLSREEMITIEVGLYA
jgi:hypothetical protein